MRTTLSSSTHGAAALTAESVLISVVSPSTIITNLSLHTIATENLTVHHKPLFPPVCISTRARAGIIFNRRAMDLAHKSVGGRQQAVANPNHLVGLLPSHPTHDLVHLILTHQHPQKDSPGHSQRKISKKTTMTASAKIHGRRVWRALMSTQLTAQSRQSLTRQSRTCSFPNKQP